jgi:hypothetical protein
MYVHRCKIVADQPRQFVSLYDQWCLPVQAHMPSNCLHQSLLRRLPYSPKPRIHHQPELKKTNIHSCNGMQWQIHLVIVPSLAMASHRMHVRTHTVAPTMQERSLQLLAAGGERPPQPCPDRQLSVDHKSHGAGACGIARPTQRHPLQACATLVGDYQWPRQESWRPGSTSCYSAGINHGQL